MEAHLIFGPTSTGKTSVAIALAKRTGFPVIVLDRIQCYSQLSVGGGRPSAAEFQGTRRIYLIEGSLDEGVISAERAHECLVAAVEAHKPEGGVILEGGSISLFKRMAQSSYWNCGFTWHVTRLHLGGEEIFLAAAKKRINQMMQPDEQGNSFLGELVSVWKTTALRATLEGICGYRYAIEFAGKQGLEMDALTSLNRRQLEQLVHGMAHEYLCYARQQEQELPLPSLAGGEGPPFQ